MLSIAEIDALDCGAFVARFGGVFEHSPWVAERAWASRPFGSLSALHDAMAQAVREASEDEQLALLRAHPDLAGRAAIAGEVTVESKGEQASAGLDRLTAEEMARFTSLNDAYRARFGFPFIMAVRHADKFRILDSFARRVKNTPGAEKQTALAEVAKIAWMRLLDMVVPNPTGRLTTHVLDTATGRPASGMRLFLHAVDGSERRLLGEFVTNTDGRLDAPALSGAELKAGTYELEFLAGAYFSATSQPTAAPSFLDRIPLRFAIGNPEQHYHVPLLVSPWSYSTYRGS